MRNLLVAVFLLCVPLALHADEASRLAKAHEFFRLAKTDKIAEQTMSMAASQVTANMIGNMLGVTLSAEQQEQFDATRWRVMQLMQQVLGWQALEPEYAKLYAAAYTDQELDDLLAFYRSAAGQAMVDKTPEIMRQANSIVQTRMGAATSQIQQIMKDSMKQAGASAPK